VNIKQLEKSIEQIEAVVKLLDSAPIAEVAPHRSDVALKLKDALDDLEAIALMMRADRMTILEKCRWCNNYLASEEFRADVGSVGCPEFFCSKECLAEWQSEHANPEITPDLLPAWIRSTLA